MDALGWIAPWSPTTEWDAAQVRRLARRLAYSLRWADQASTFALPEQVESTGIEVALLSSSAHVDAVTLDRMMAFADIECAAPRASFGRWSPVGGLRR